MVKAQARLESDVPSICFVFNLGPGNILISQGCFCVDIRKGEVPWGQGGSSMDKIDRISLAAIKLVS